MFRYYLIVIFGGMGSIALIGALFDGASPWVAVLAALLGTVAAFLLDALVALLVRYCIPEEKMNPFHRCWRVWKWERKCYVKLGIRRWKDKIPETGGLLVGFSKKSVGARRDNTYILKFLRETCYAELMHTLSIPAGFCILPLAFAFPDLHFIAFVGLPVALVNAVLQLLPILVQRYVRPFLLSTYRYNERHSHT